MQRNLKMTANAKSEKEGQDEDRSGCGTDIYNPHHMTANLMCLLRMGRNDLKFRLVSLFHFSDPASLTHRDSVQLKGRPSESGRQNSQKRSRVVVTRAGSGGNREMLVKEYKLPVSR